MTEKLVITCSGIFEGGEFPLENTGFGANQSPEFHLKNLSQKARTLAIILEDLDHPLKKNFTHWLIWNLPALSHVPAGIEKGSEVTYPSGARQGISYGWYRYAGPKPPMGRVHRYRFTIYSLDIVLDLNRWTDKGRLLRAMEGHILQKGTLTATFGDKKIWNQVPRMLKQS
ncbi:YbhB/YbcL family Raf kinase inhibitor-like protein [Streptococcus dentiloxodontae]